MTSTRPAAAPRVPTAPDRAAAAGPKGTPTIGYSERRRHRDKASSYNVKYQVQLHKRISDRREKRLLAAILARVGRQDLVLDVPCGAGRLSGVLASVAGRLVEVDYSAPMLDFCRGNAAGYAPECANASAFDLPFRDRTFDLVACIRLSHHVPARADRLALLRELLRVSCGRVLVTFFDEGSVKNRLRRLRGRLFGKKPKKTLARAEVAAVAAEAGFEVEGQWRLSALFSGHTFALLRRRGA